MITTESKKLLRMRINNLLFFLKGYSFKSATDFNYEAVLPHEWCLFSSKIKTRSELGDQNQNRIHNMALAAKLFSNLMIYPGQIFRFWKIIPYPNKKSKFLEGPAITDGALSTDFGGGLCQVSSTLFNAFLEANLEILEKHNHSADIHGENRFIALGRDAAVAYGYKDLIIRNNTDTTIQLIVNVNKEKMQFEAGIYANISFPFDVKIESKIIKKIEGDYSQTNLPGWVVYTERAVQLISEKAGWVKNYHKEEYYNPS